MTVSNHGDERIVKRFALLPISAGSNVVWLKTVYIKQVYVIRSYEYEHWENRGFVSKFTYQKYLAKKKRKAKSKL